MAKMLKGDQAELLAEACKLNKTKKDAEKRLGEIKGELKKLKPGDYTNRGGDTLNVSVTDKTSDVDAMSLFNYFKRKKQTSRFWACVKVQLGELRKQVPETTIDKWIDKLGETKKFTFK